MSDTGSERKSDLEKLAEVALREGFKLEFDTHKILNDFFENLTYLFTAPT